MRLPFSCVRFRVGEVAASALSMFHVNPSAVVPGTDSGRGLKSSRTGITLPALDSAW